VQGFGVHRLTCVGYNNAKDGAGTYGASAPATWTLEIRQPSVSTLSFARIGGSPHCVWTRSRVRIPAQWVTVMVHGRSVRVKVRAQTRIVKRKRCRPRTATQRIRVHGHWTKRRFRIGARNRTESYERVPFGRRTTVSGWLGTADGSALAGQRIRILTAPDNGTTSFQEAASTTTAPDGTWSVRLPAGPSRLVKSEYDGDTAVEPSYSRVAHLAVPASVRLDSSPNLTPCGGMIVIMGTLRGGFTPLAASLVVFKVGWHGGSAEIGHLYTKQTDAYE